MNYLLGGLLIDLDPKVTDLLLPVGLLLITMALMAALYRNRQRSSNQTTAREQLEQLNQKKGMRRDLESLMVEIEQFAKRFSAQLDAKTIHLEKLIRDAESRIAQLNALLTDTRHTPNGTKSTGSPSTGTEMPEAKDPFVSRIHELADEGLSPLDIARKLDEHPGKIELILALREA